MARVLNTTQVFIHQGLVFFLASPLGGSDVKGGGGKCAMTQQCSSSAESLEINW